LTLEELGESNPAFNTATFRVPVSDAEAMAEVVKGAKLFMSPHGKVEAIPATRSIVVIDYPEHLEKVRAFIADLSASSDAGPITGNQFERFAVQHVLAADIKTALEGAVGEGGTIAALEKENIVLVNGPPPMLDMVRQMIKQLDMPRKQIRITAYIYDIALDESERMGINWNHAASGRNMNADGMGDDLFGFNSGILGAATEMASDTADAAADAGAGAAMTTGAAAGVESGTMMIRSLSRNFDITSTIQMLDETRGARLLADPRVVVYNHEEATMKAVREVPYQQETQSTDGGSVASTEFREAGVTLTVTPRAADDGTITMDVAPTFSVLAGFQDGQPIIDTREANTKVRVANGQTIIIGGLRQRSEVETVTGVPHLKDWKYFGKLFRSHQTTVVESELLVFIKPEIVDEITIGTDREAHAQAISESTLERLLPPHDGPFIPGCSDAYCPYHNPRIRAQGSWGGAETKCIHGHIHEVEQPIQQPVQATTALPRTAGKMTYAHSARMSQRRSQWNAQSQGAEPATPHASNDPSSRPSLAASRQSASHWQSSQLGERS
ncbi:MAG: secretin N-terminal domain-containing protein, partial [Pirellulaceae bacterium]|nr:secretin N-terminal domain-containing protein [Pirellulaceae bacterium]